MNIKFPFVKVSLYKLGVYKWAHVVTWTKFLWYEIMMDSKLGTQFFEHHLDLL